jgi:hypothetical protein
MTWLASSSSPDKQEQGGDDFLLILNRNLFRMHCPERKLHKKKWVRGESRMAAASTEGKNNRV